MHPVRGYRCPILLHLLRIQLPLLHVCCRLWLRAGATWFLPPGPARPRLRLWIEASARKRRWRPAMRVSNPGRRHRHRPGYHDRHKSAHARPCSGKERPVGPLHWLLLLLLPAILGPLYLFWFFLYQKRLTLVALIALLLLLLRWRSRRWHSVSPATASCSSGRRRRSSCTPAATHPGL